MTTENRGRAAGAGAGAGANAAGNKIRRAAETADTNLEFGEELGAEGYSPNTATPSAGIAPNNRAAMGNRQGGNQ